MVDLNKIKERAQVEGVSINLILEIETFKAKDKTHIEIMNIPSYEHQAMIIKRQDILVNPAITVESPQEILSDKLVALGSREYLKGRDIWDIYFILNTLKISLNKDILKMVKRKIIDYHMNDEEFRLKFQNNLGLLEKEGGRVLKQEMDKFLPVSYRESFEKRYKSISEEVLNFSLAVRGASK